jgi:hypothetical protein
MDSRAKYGWSGLQSAFTAPKFSAAIGDAISMFPRISLFLKKKLQELHLLCLLFSYSNGSFWPLSMQFSSSLNKSKCCVKGI